MSSICLTSTIVNVCQFEISVWLTLLPVIGYLVEGINVTDQDIAFWNSYITSQDTNDTNVAGSSYSAKKSAVQNVAPYKDANVMIQFYDPELAAFMGTQ